MKIPLQQIVDPLIASSGIHLFMLRLDLIHPHISGNKWYKLKYNIGVGSAELGGGIITFGGAYSNHIAAVAAAGKENGIKTIGIIRGDELGTSPPVPPGRDSTPLLKQERSEQPPLNPTLQFARGCGMKLIFVSREIYKQVRTGAKLPDDVLSQLPAPPSQLYFLPEGGTNALAVKGCAEILSHIDIPFDFVCCPVGTGGTLAGIISSLKKNQEAIGFSALKAPDYHEAEIGKWLAALQIRRSADFQIAEGYHFGGYGKHTPELLQFISNFEKANNIPLEQVYTGKMMFGIYDLIKKNHFPKGSTVIAIHTGGLQGKLH